MGILVNLLGKRSPIEERGSLCGSTENGPLHSEWAETGLEANGINQNEGKRRKPTLEPMNSLKLRSQKDLLNLQLLQLALRPLSQSTSTWLFYLIWFSII